MYTISKWLTMLALFGVPVAANAQTATYDFTGVITSVQGTAFNLSVGATITGTYTFNYAPLYDPNNPGTIMGIIGSTTGWNAECCEYYSLAQLFTDTINGGSLTGPELEYPGSEIYSTSAGNISAEFSDTDGQYSGETSSVTLIALSGKTAFMSNGLPNAATIDLSASSGMAEISDGPPNSMITYRLTSFTLAPVATTTLKVSPTTAPFGSPVSLTASVTAAEGEPTPAGTVTFKSGAKTLGQMTLNATGEATLTVTSLAVGLDPIVAVYSGSSTFNASTSATVEVTISSAPVASLTPDSAAFPLTVVGTVQDDQVILKNLGSMPLTIKAIGLKGAEASSFLYISECGASLGVGKSCVVYFGFAPKKAGRATATLAFSDNAPGSPQGVTLTGTGVNHEITVAPAALVFPATPVGGSSLGQTVTLTDAVITVATITSIVINGADPRDFVTLNNCGETLEAGASCSVFVAFNPTAKGKRTATLSVTDGASPSPQTVTLSGTGK